MLTIQKSQSIITVVCAVFMSSCTFKIIELKDFNPSQPITVEKQTIGFLVTQDGNMLKNESIQDGLKLNADASKKMEYWWPLTLGAFTLGVSGGGLVGIGAAAGNLDYILGGFGAIGLGYYSGSVADEKLLRAIELHNASLKNTAL